MDAIVGVWLTSIVGAGAFSAAGYILGQRGVVLPFLGLGASPPPVRRELEDRPTPEVAPAARDVARAASAESLPPAMPSARPNPTPEVPTTTDGASDDEETRVAFVPEAITRSAAPPSDSQVVIVREQLEATKTDLAAALTKAESAEERARAADAVKAELERQIEALRAELRDEVVVRATASAHADELGDRLARASEEAASLRHKVALLDKQSKQLREALQGRVRALTTSEWHRRRDLEETEEMRVKLRDVYDKLERSSLPPADAALGSDPPAARTPSTPATARQGSPSSPVPAKPASLRPTSDEHLVLQAEVARLAAENRDLRARALGSLPPKKAPSRGSAPDLDLDVYRQLVERVGGAAGLQCAVIADELGSLLAGSGELAESLAAFGAYIRDASSRTERLLPLEGVDEIDIRDRRGALLSTRVITRSPSELSLVLLGGAGASLAAAKKIADETLRLRQA